MAPLLVLLSLWGLNKCFIGTCLSIIFHQYSLYIGTIFFSFFISLLVANGPAVKPVYRHCVSLRLVRGAYDTDRAQLAPWRLTITCPGLNGDVRDVLDDVTRSDGSLSLGGGQAWQARWCQHFRPLHLTLTSSFIKRANIIPFRCHHYLCTRSWHIIIHLPIYYNGHLPVITFLCFMHLVAQVNNYVFSIYLFI